ncbi:ankyrin repeat domain-containing protein [Pseudomonas vanderleydeniana]|uniref:Ankyrin repeat domain-containing protein n=1 Tax=Pseudomonas vanderleydeniana TaxID=2745495 RepID=A0A9E6PR15_9PSED|nr:ankyrin repeat domain-containing protein [Pseudomonas vanderleydeniana]QXI31314.1 ankyrin repeat domain-containing protein [Pseudomonas vanderleydeniana]
MSALQNLVEQAYEQAKRGNWDQLLVEWNEIPQLARRCCHYQKASSGWTFLHQAAYFGHETACRALIRLGASLDSVTYKEQTAADIAREQGHPALSETLRHALQGSESLWVSPNDPDLLPSSQLWQEAIERRAQAPMLVAYAGGAVRIAKGARYYADSFERTLVGWHGTYDPPCGMDGESVLRPA